MPLPNPLSAKNEGTFAYHTVKERLPTIMTRALDTFRREFKKVNASPEAEAEAKQVLALLSELHYLMMTDKPLQPLQAIHAPDYSRWKQAIESEERKTGQLTWFSSAWLFVECYLYRLLADFFLRTNCFAHYDPFESQKVHSLKANMASVKLLSRLVTEKGGSAREWLELSLWGNRCDLSLKNTTPSFQNLMSELQSLRPKIVVNETEEVVKRIDSLRHANHVTVDYVLDNAGFELFTDLCLMLFLSRILPSSARIRIHVKSYPWFVSDVMRKDFVWMMDHLKADPEVKDFGTACSEHLASGKWHLVDSYFWTLPYDYALMPTQEPELYRQLQSSSLILFKGDLNYRKLLGDLDWPHATPFDEVLRQFRPSFLVVLRTNKADLISGLSPALEAHLPSDFLTTGEYAVVQVSTPAKRH